MHDIQNHNDIDLLVSHFYNKVLNDAIIGFLFTDIAHINLDTHLPKISAFWQRQLLGSNQYRGRVFEAHQKVHHLAELTQHHFHRWLHLFNQSVDELFIGSIADKAKQQAKAIAGSMLEGLQNRHMASILTSREKKGVSIFTPNKQDE